MESNWVMNVGVIVGRFQVPFLHDGHKKLIQDVKSKHNKLIIFLGTSATINTRRNPLDIWTRKAMIQNEYPDILISHIMDQGSDEFWSNDLDQKINELVPNCKITLYGSRDSFIEHYTGKHETKTIDEYPGLNGTEYRDIISNEVLTSEDSRKGIIYAANSRFPAVFPVVDIACVDFDKNCVLMARKHSEDRYRFIGGFVDIRDDSLESAAKREFSEETGMAEPSEMEYIGSYVIEDYRYRNEIDKVMTSFFCTTLRFGPLRASDDIEELKWISLKDMTEKHLYIIVKEHQELVSELIHYLIKRKGILQND